jgi:autotransporter-associated beta strand protein
MGKSFKSRWDNFRNKLNLGKNKKPKKNPPRKRSFGIERLEDRELLSVCIWNGGGNNNLWTNAANWAGHAAPVAGDTLQFSGNARTATHNDYAAGTSFASIEFAGNNFSISGNAVTLSGSIIVDAGVSGSIISENIALGGSVIANVANAESLTISGVLSGGNSFTKLGEGTLTLTGANTYTGDSATSEGWRVQWETNPPGQ